MSETPYRSNAELREEISRLRAKVESLEYRDDPARFQCELEDIVRAQHSVEQILRLLREINPSILAIDPHEGRTMIGHAMHSMNDIKRALRHHYYREFPALGWKESPQPFTDLLKEMANTESDFEI